MTFAQQKEIYRVLAAHYEPIYQRSEAVTLLAMVRECIKPYVNYVLLTDEHMDEMRSDVDTVLHEWRTAPKRLGYSSRFYNKVNVVLTVPDNPLTQHPPNNIVITPNRYLQRMLDGKAPVRLFDPSAERLEELWVEFTTKDERVVK